MQRVLIVGAGEVIDDGLWRLLSQGLTAPDLLRVAYENDVSILRLLLEWRPAVIVLFEGGPMTVRRVFELINSVSDLMAVKVITALDDAGPIDLHEKQLAEASN